MPRTCSTGTGAPSTSACSSSLTRSWPGWRRRSSTASMKKAAMAFQPGTLRSGSWPYSRTSRTQPVNVSLSSSGTPSIHEITRTGIRWA